MDRMTICMLLVVIMDMGCKNDINDANVNYNEKVDTFHTRQFDNNVYTLDSNILPLKETPKTYSYLSETGREILVTLHLHEMKDSTYAIIEENGKIIYKLNMMEAWAKGASFTAGNVRWDAFGESGILKKGDSTFSFKVK